jgi:hypothetical protein
METRHPRLTRVLADGDEVIVQLSRRNETESDRWQPEYRLAYTLDGARTLRDELSEVIEAIEANLHPASH